jgi:type III restriction enzyme
MADVDVWTVSNLVYWLDNSLKQEDIPQSDMVFWLNKVINSLIEKRKIPITKLMIAKYALLNKLLSKIAEARKKAKTKSFELFERESRKKLDFDRPFYFTHDMYDDQLFYQGKYKFQKHFLGSNKIPVFDGGEKGEECACAKAIDASPEVEFWLRIVARHPKSFRLPTSTDNFYPDFIAKLKDGRILVVEYKGEYLASSDDTKEKKLIGELWEKEGKGQNLFLLAVNNRDGKGVAEQIKEKIA